MNQDVLTSNEPKIQIAEEILSLNLNILKVLSRNNDYKLNPEIFKFINDLQKHILGYLKKKYPRGGKII